MIEISFSNPVVALPEEMHIDKSAGHSQVQESTLNFIVPEIPLSAFWQRPNFGARLSEEAKKVLCTW